MPTQDEIIKAMQTIKDVCSEHINKLPDRCLGCPLGFMSNGFQECMAWSGAPYSWVINRNG